MNGRSEQAGFRTGRLLKMVDTPMVWFTNAIMVGLLVGAGAMAQTAPTGPNPNSQDKGSTSNPPAQAADNLPWQPGLGGRQIPPQHVDPPAAQPIPSAATIPPSMDQATASIPQAAPAHPVEHSVVMPAAFFQENQSAAPAAGSNATNTETNTGITRVTRDFDVLPSDAGQVWRSYDISPYTYSITTTNRPQQALIDWILKETGTDLWFSEPLGIMNASRDKLHIYHTPEIQARIQAIVDRFVFSRGNAQLMGLKLVTITSPNWRTTAFSMLQPVEVQTPGVEAWLLSKEHAALLGNQIRNRTDYQEHSNGDLPVLSGQKYALTRTRPVSFVRSLQWISEGGGRYEPLMDRVDEGFSLEISNLGSIDGQVQEVIIRCNIDQIEKMQRVGVDLPTPSGQLQTVDLHIPQMVVWRLHERFRWPSDKVLLLSCGVVAAPTPQPNGILGLQSLVNGGRDRADALLFIEYKGPAGQAANPQQPAQLGQMMPINGRR